jgi:O-antigen ligase
VTGAVGSIRQHGRRRVSWSKPGSSPSIDRAIVGRPHRLLAAGLAISVLLLVATGLEVAPAVQALAGFSVLVAFVSPATGLAIAAATLSLREPEVFRPLSFPVVLMGALAAGAVARSVVDRRKLGPSVFLLASTGYLALGAVTLPPPVNGLSFAASASATTEFFNLAGGLVLLIVGRNVLRDVDARPYLLAVLGSASVAAILAFLRFGRATAEGLPLPGLFGQGEATLRAVGAFANPNYFGLFAVVATLVALGLAVTSGPILRLVLIAVATMLAGAVLLSFSRGDALALAAGIITLAWLRGRRFGIVVTVVAALIGAIAFPLVVDARLRLTTGGIYARPNIDLEQSDSFRADAFEAGVRIVGESPIFGSGFGQYRFRAERFVGNNPTAYPHNTWIKILAEQGIVGVAMFATLATMLVVAVWRSRHPLRRTALAALVAYAVGATFAEPLVILQVSTILWLTLAAVLGGGWIDRRAPDTRLVLRTTMAEA